VTIGYSPSPAVHNASEWLGHGTHEGDSLRVSASGSNDRRWRLAASTAQLRRPLLQAQGPTGQIYSSGTLAVTAVARRRGAAVRRPGGAWALGAALGAVVWKNPAAESGHRTNAFEFFDTHRPSIGGSRAVVLMHV
jgi:hypothetical protein